MPLLVAVRVYPHSKRDLFCTPPFARLYWPVPFALGTKVYG